MKKIRPRSGRPLSFPHCCLAILSASIANLGFAQEDPNRIVPSISVLETATDNVSLRRSEVAKSDWITSIRPSLLATSKGGRVEGSLQTSLNINHYADSDNLSKNFVTLRGTGRVEAWQDRGFIDLKASVSREVLSAFAPQAGDSVTGSTNQGSVRSFTVSPYLNGRFGSTGKANLRYTYVNTDSDSATFLSTQSNTFMLDLSDPGAFGTLGWEVSLADIARQTANRRDLNSQSVRARGLFQVDPQILLRLIVGTEKNNYRSAQESRASILGMSGEWALSPLTKVSGLWEDRFFGPGYLFSFQHRSGKLLFTGNYSKDSTNTSSALSGVAMVSTYDYLMDIFQGQVGDEVARDLLVRKYISDNQLPDTVGLRQSMLSNSVFLDRRLRFGLTITEGRSSLLLTAFRSRRTTLTDQSFSLGGDFEQASQLTDTGGSAVFSHKLTPLSSGSLGVTMKRTHRDGTVAGADLSIHSRIYTAALTTKFTPQAGGSLTFRNNKAEGSTSYTENAIIGSVAVRF